MSQKQDLVVSYQPPISMYILVILGLGLLGAGEWEFVFCLQWWLELAHSEIGKFRHDMTARSGIAQIKNGRKGWLNRIVDW